MSSRRVWTEEEDQAIRELVKKFGNKNWASIAEQLSSQFGTSPRSGKQCRQRWHNHLNPGIEKKLWSKLEEEKMFKLHKIHGNKWTIIAKALPGRTDNSIKNYFYSTIRRSLRRMGKFVGTKNSTKQMKNIKPSTLSKIFQAGSISAPEEALQQKEVELLALIKDSCETVRDSIIKFTNYKPKKNDKADQQERAQLEDVIKKMVHINEMYEKIKFDEKRQKNEELMFQKDSGKFDDFDEDSVSEEEINPSSLERERELSEENGKKSLLPSKLDKRKEKSDPATPVTDIKVVQNTLYTVPTVIIKSQQYPSESDNIENHLINENPEFFVQIKDQPPEYLIKKRSSFSFQSPGVFFNTPSNNPFTYFQSPSTPKSYDGSIGMLGTFQNNALDDFKNLIQKQIEGNLAGQGKMSASTTTIGCSPGSAFSYINFH